MADVPVLYDADVEALAEMGELVAVMEESLRAKAEGRLQGPARVHASTGDGELIFTVGGQVDASGQGGVAGFRAYGFFPPVGRSDHLTAVFDLATGKVRGLFVSALLGELRTGAIGGAAINALARPDASVLGVVGTGKQARTQLMAAAAVRRLDEVRVFGRDADRREAFAQRMTDQLGLSVRAVGRAEAAAQDADIVILATTSRTPVLERAWLKPGAHVTTVGLKTKDAHELSLEVAEAAAVIATDSVAQNLSAGDRHMLHGTPAHDRTVDLGDIVAGSAQGRLSPDQLTLFLSTGLAGTEVTVGAHLLNRRR